MLHAPTSETKNRAESSKTQSEPQVEMELQAHPLDFGWFSKQHFIDSGEADTRFGRCRGNLANVQQTFGNQAVLRRMSKGKSHNAPLPIQTKLKISQPGDPYEQEADRIADEVMRMPEPQLQRACTCKGKCTRCSSDGKPDKAYKRLQTKRVHAGNPGNLGVSPIVRDVLHSAGKPLDSATRSFMEPRFGFDFNQVRVHADSKAAESAESINALAYTVGRDIVFAADQYMPHSTEGQQLLAHELTHVVQQSKFRGSPQATLTISPNNDLAEKKANHTIKNITSRHNSKDISQLSIFELYRMQLAKQKTLETKISTVAQPSILQRIVRVDPPTAANDILSQFNTLCPGQFSLTGNQRITANCTMSSRGCECLCDAASDRARDYAISVQPGMASRRRTRLHNGTIADIPVSTVWPNTLDGQHPSITLTESFSAIEFGFFQADGRPVWYRDWRILAHELCGHGRLNQTYPGRTGNRPGHDVTIDTENAIAAEHGRPARGHFADPRQGETFYNPAGDRSRVVFHQVNGTHYEPP